MTRILQVCRSIEMAIRLQAYMELSFSEHKFTRDGLSVSVADGYRLKPHEYRTLSEVSMAFYVGYCGALREVSHV